MRIVFISHTAGSPWHGMLFRPYYFANEFSKLGHQTTIITASFFHTRVKNPCITSDWSAEEVGIVRFIWLKTLNYKSSTVKRALGMLIFALKLIIYSPRIANTLKPDVVIATSPDPLIIFGAWAAARIGNAKLVFEFRDIWPLTLTTIGKLSYWNPLVILFSIAERFALRTADIVVSPLSNAASYLLKRGYPIQNFMVIPNGVDTTKTSEVQPNCLDDQTLRTLRTIRSDNQLLIGYTGHHGIATFLDGVIGAMQCLQHLPIALVLVGDGSEKDSLRRYAESLNLKNVHFLNPILKSRIPEALALFDACYLASPPSPLYQYGTSPNKLFDYMLAAKPVISALANKDDIVVLAGCGIKASGQDAQSIADAIEVLFRLSKLERQVMGINGQVYVHTHHSYRLLAERYINLLGS